MLQPSGPGHAHAQTHTRVTVSEMTSDFENLLINNFKTSWLEGRGKTGSHITFSLLLLLGLLVLLGNQCWLLGEWLPNQSVGCRICRYWETVIKSDWVRTTGGNIKCPIE